MSSRSRTALGLALLLGLAAPALPALLGEGLPAAERALWQTLAVQACWCGLAGLIALRLGGSVRGRLGLARGGLSAGRLAVAALGTLALSGALQFAVEALALAPGSSLERLDSIARAAAPSRPGLVLLAFGIAPGIGEELLFRGALQRSLARPIGAWCVPVAGLAFGALHMDLVHSPAAFALGCYLGAVALLMRSTWAAVACHVANNCAAVLTQLLAEPAAALPRPGSWPEAAAWLAISALGLTLVARHSRWREAPPGGCTPASG